jgi:hypothetical protein
MRRLVMRLAPVVVAFVLGCEADDEEPRTLISAPRVLAIVAEPPEVPPGASSTVTAMIVGTPQAPTITWTRCRLAPLPGQSTNTDCVTNLQASYNEPIGQGATVTATMPADATPESLGQPDASGGVYLSLIANVTAGADSFVGVYRLRLGPGAAGNQNPVQGVVFVDEGAATVPLDEAAPLSVRPGDRLALGVDLLDGSVQTYDSPIGGLSGGGGPIQESLRTAWFSTAGDFSNDRTNDAQPRTVLILDEFLPPAGSTIDLYAVTRDERGGCDFAHRTLRLE